MARILAFNLDDSQMKLLLGAAGSFEISVFAVSPLLYGAKIRDILDGNATGYAAENVPQFTEEMLVFDGFDDEELYEFLNAMKRTGMRFISLKASVTEFNKGWTPAALGAELIRERDEFLKRAGK